MAKARARESARELPGLGEPVGGELLQRLSDRGVDVERDRPSNGRRGDGHALDDLAEHGLRRAAGVRRLPDQHLVEHAGQREDVARRTHDLISGRLLG